MVSCLPRWQTNLPESKGWSLCYEGGGRVSFCALRTNRNSLIMNWMRFISSSIHVGPYSAGVRPRFTAQGISSPGFCCLKRVFLITVTKRTLESMT